MAEAEEVTVEELLEACKAAGSDFSNISTDFRQNVSFAEDYMQSENSSHNGFADSDLQLAGTETLLGKRRKRKHLGKSNWVNQVQKTKRMRGEEYLGYTSAGNNSKKRVLEKPKKARKMGPTCKSSVCAKSSKRFCSQFPETARDQLFKDFWNLMDWEAKKTCVRNLVDRTTTNQPRKGLDSRRSETFIYYLKLNGIKRHVCRGMFLHTLGLKRRQVRNWLIEKEESLPLKQNAPKVNSSEKEISAREFLQKLPKLPSHYCRADTQQLYIEPEFQNYSELHSAYANDCKEKNTPFYSRIHFVALMKELKISIYHPKKDECDTCCAYKQGNLSEEDFNQHIKKKESARNEKKRDKLLAIAKKCHVIVVDVKAVFLSPKLNASALYYKTKLAIHNFSIFNLSTRHAKCFLWDETEGELVASVFATCLINYLEENFSDNLPIIIYSDGCTNQNRNAVLSSALLNYSVKKNKIITQKYLEKGHTQNEVDSVHSTIERNLKNKVIHLPTDYIKICKDARKSPAPYDVQYLNFSEFRDYTKSQTYSSIRPGSKKGEPHVTDLRQLKYEPTGKIFYKLNHEHDWIGLPQTARKMSIKGCPNLYQKRLPISKRKYNDLQEMLSVLPSTSHNYYVSLPHQKQ